MDNNNSMPEVRAAAGGISAPEMPKAPAFSASWREILAAVLLFALAYVYVDRILFGWEDIRWALLLFTLGFVALTELLCWEKPRTRESWFWLLCLGLILAGMLLRGDRADGPEPVWDQSQCLLFLHLDAVWWVLHRSGSLLEGESGHLLPVDGLDGFVIFPFKHYFLRVRSLWYGLSRIGRGKKRPAWGAVFWSLGAVCLAALLFFLATRLLQAADESFDRLVSRVLRWLTLPDWDIDWFMAFLSLPVGAWLFGLLAGSAREDRETLDARAAGWREGLAKLRRVPAPVWPILCGCFCLLYLVFFVLQARYLFGAFTRTLPEGFIVSQYARQGFFELCRVMAVNLVLLWLMVRSSVRPVRVDRPSLALCLVLLAESLLLAVVALSKLWLYIDCFGFTPLRLQSSWLVCVLILGCLAAGYSLTTGKKSLKLWLLIAMGSLSLLCLV